MAYHINGTEYETDDQGYLLEPNYDDEAPRVIAASEGIELTDAHWEVIAYMREQYREHGDARHHRPCPDITWIQILELTQDPPEVDLRQSARFHFAPPCSAGARLIQAFMLNSLRRRLSTAAALISSSSGFSNQGDASMLRISVETRALDWARPTSSIFCPSCFIERR